MIEKLKTKHKLIIRCQNKIYKCFETAASVEILTIFIVYKHLIHLFLYLKEIFVSWNIKYIPL